MPRPTIWHESARRQFAIRVCVFVKVHNVFDAGTADVRQTLPTLQFRPEAIGSGVLSGSHDQRPFGHCWREGSAVLQCLPTTGGAVSQADYPVAQAYSYPQRPDHRPIVWSNRDAVARRADRRRLRFGMPRLGCHIGPPSTGYAASGYAQQLSGGLPELTRHVWGIPRRAMIPHGDDEREREAADRSPKNGRDCDVSHRSHDAVRSAE